MKHTLFSRTVQIACVKTHTSLRTRPMRFYACVIFDVIIRSEKTQRILSESTLMYLTLVSLSHFFLSFPFYLNLPVPLYLGSPHFNPSVFVLSFLIMSSSPLI